MDISFSDYLEAKFALDERSLNPDVWQACCDALKSNNHLRCLDVGTGTGAMVRRLVESGFEASLAITALDQDPHLLEIASATIAMQLTRRGAHVRSSRNKVSSEHRGRQIGIEFHHCGLFEFKPDIPPRYDLITTHNFMDLVAMAPALTLFAKWLVEGGSFYATLNYDGHTVLFPFYCDEAFENSLLAAYDASMESRSDQGELTGGAMSGRRLHRLLEPAGFQVGAYGSSDWNITPHRGRYRDRDSIVLTALLGMIRGEGERSGVDPRRLARWYADRLACLETAQLGMIIHQLDILATRRQDFTALT